MKKSQQTVVHNLNAGKCVNVLVNYIMGLFPRSSEEDMPSTEISVDHKVHIHATDLLPNFGKTIWSKKTDRSFGIKVPDKMALIKALNAHAGMKTNSRSETFNRFSQELSDCHDSTANYDKVLQLFEAAPPEQQSQYIRVTKLTMAGDILFLLLVEEILSCPEIFPGCYSLDPKLDDSIKAHRGYYKNFLGQIPMKIKFFQSFYWEQLFIPPEGIKCFLSEEAWDAMVVVTKSSARVSKGDKQPPDLDLAGGEPVNRSDPDVDVDRWDFYASLGCKEVVRPTGGQWEKDQYVAYILRTADGIPVAFVDSSRRGNAVYAFWIKEGWAQHAQENKQSVRAKAGTEWHTYAVRFYHTVTWQERVRNWRAKAAPPSDTFATT